MAENSIDRFLADTEEDNTSQILNVNQIRLRLENLSHLFQELATLITKTNNTQEELQSSLQATEERWKSLQTFNQEIQKKKETGMIALQRIHATLDTSFQFREIQSDETIPETLESLKTKLQNINEELESPTSIAHSNPIDQITITNEDKEEMAQIQRQTEKYRETLKTTHETIKVIQEQQNELNTKINQIDTQLQVLYVATQNMFENITIATKALQRFHDLITSKSALDTVLATSLNERETENKFSDIRDLLILDEEAQELEPTLAFVIKGGETNEITRQMVSLSRELENLEKNARWVYQQYKQINKEYILLKNQVQELDEKPSYQKDKAFLDNKTFIRLSQSFDDVTKLISQTQPVATEYNMAAISKALDEKFNCDLLTEAENKARNRFQEAENNQRQLPIQAESYNEQKIESDKLLDVKIENSDGEALTKHESSVDELKAKVKKNQSTTVELSQYFQGYGMETEHDEAKNLCKSLQNLLNELRIRVAAINQIWETHKAQEKAEREEEAVLQEKANKVAELQITAGEKETSIEQKTRALARLVSEQKPETYTDAYAQAKEIVDQLEEPPCVDDLLAELRGIIKQLEVMEAVSLINLEELVRNHQNKVNDAEKRIQRLLPVIVKKFDFQPVISKVEKFIEYYKYAISPKGALTDDKVGISTNNYKKRAKKASDLYKILTSHEFPIQEIQQKEALSPDDQDVVELFHEIESLIQQIEELLATYNDIINISGDTITIVRGALEPKFV